MNDTIIINYHPSIKASYDKLLRSYLIANPDVIIDPVVGLSKVLNDANTVFDLIGNSIGYNDEDMVKLYHTYGIDYINVETMGELINHYVNFLESLDMSSQIGQEPSSRVLQFRILSGTGLFYLKLNEPLPNHKEVKLFYDNYVIDKG